MERAIQEEDERERLTLHRLLFLINKGASLDDAKISLGISSSEFFSAVYLLKEKGFIEFLSSGVELTDNGRVYLEQKFSSFVLKELSWLKTDQPLSADSVYLPKLSKWRGSRE